MTGWTAIALTWIGVTVTALVCIARHAPAHAAALARDGLLYWSSVAVTALAVLYIATH